MSVTGIIILSTFTINFVWGKNNDKDQDLKKYLDLKAQVIHLNVQT